MKKTIIPCVFTILLFAGCQKYRVIELQLKHAKELMLEHPDSTLHILKSINRKTLDSRHIKAQYALLLSQALDKNYIDINSDSLIRIAYDYYGNRNSSDSLKFLLEYCYGRIFQNAGDFQQAIRRYLAAEQYGNAMQNSYFLGLVTTRIGEIYAEQMNFDGMLFYHRQAYAHFHRLNNPLYENRELLNIANAYTKLKDHPNALLYYSKAIKMAEQYGNDELKVICLGNIGLIFAAQNKADSLLYAISEIRCIAPQSLSRFEYELLADAYFMQHKLDSARFYLNLARKTTIDIRDKASLAYLSFEIAMASENYDKARKEIDEYIFYSDSVMRMTTAQSAAAAEGKYFREKSDFMDYRLQVRTRFEFLVMLIVLIFVGAVLGFYKILMRQHRLQMERYMIAVDELRSSKEKIIIQLLQKEISENNLKEQVLYRFGILDQLGRAFYERENTKAQQEVIYKQVKQLFSALSTCGSQVRKELEYTINMANDDILIKLRNQFPKLRSSDIDILCYLFAGFSVQVISILTQDTVSNIYSRKSRLRARISASEVSDKELFLRKMK